VLEMLILVNIGRKEIANLSEFGKIDAENILY
jgi:hypothetical protein